jgi:putative transposase
VTWYNEKHRHSAIGFVTPSQRHCGDDRRILRKRAALHEAARRRNPQRWSGSCRSFEHVEVVVLNPRKTSTDEAAA